MKNRIKIVVKVSGGSRISQMGGGQKPIVWPNFPRKLHENERNRTQRPVHVLDAPPPLDTPQKVDQQMHVF